MLVQKLRLQRGWSQEQLAELTGLSVRTVQRIESGKPASVESLKAFGAVFEVDFSTLKDGEMDNSNVRADEALALAHVRKVKGFYIHLAQYVVVIAALAVLNLFVSPQHVWVQWVALGWGIGVLLHGLRVFDKIPFLSGEWERRRVETYLGRKL